jgi:predicted DNA-binding transcriptional regulator YafY
MAKRKQKDSVMSAIREAADAGTKLDIVYSKIGSGRKNPGGIITRTVDPYEIRGNDFWAECNQHDEIHRFKLSRVLQADTTNIPYNPRWPVQIGSGRKTAEVKATTTAEELIQSLGINLGKEDLTSALQKITRGLKKMKGGV